MMAWFSGLWSDGPARIEPATQRDAPRLAELHGASFHRGWGEGEFETMLSERNTLVHRLRLGRKVIGFAVSRIAAEEAEILSIAVAEPVIAAAACPASCYSPILAILPAAGCAHRFPRGRGK